MSLFNIFKSDTTRHTARYSGHVVSDPTRCVQCGICSYNCPIEIDVRAFVWREEAIKNSECLTCGECVARCPRGVLSFAQTDLFERRGE